MPTIRVFNSPGKDPVKSSNLSHTGFVIEEEDGFWRMRWFSDSRGVQTLQPLGDQSVTS